MFVFYSILLFIIIYLAVRLAIIPLIPKTAQLEIDRDDTGLVKLRDMAVITNLELEEIIKLYHSESLKNEDRRQYEKYLKVLIKLKEIGFFTNEDYDKRLEILNEYYNKQGGTNLNR